MKFLNALREMKKFGDIGRVVADGKKLCIILPECEVVCDYVGDEFVGSVDIGKLILALKGRRRDFWLKVEDDRLLFVYEKRTVVFQMSSIDVDIKRKKNTVINRNNVRKLLSKLKKGFRMSKEFCVKVVFPLEVGAFEVTL